MGLRSFFSDMCGRIEQRRDTIKRPPRFPVICGATVFPPRRGPSPRRHLLARGPRPTVRAGWA